LFSSILRSVLFGLETTNEAWPVPKLNRPVTDKELSLLDCFGVAGANQGLDAPKRRERLTLFREPDHVHRRGVPRRPA
jgi:hypothetical protein